MFAVPAILAAVVQVTNGLFFAEMPFEFNRPIYPEASGLMAQNHGVKINNQKKWIYGAVEHTFDDLGAAYCSGLRVEGMAFSDRKFRHENLLWLTEVGGERYACWDTAVGPYNPVDWIDVPMAMSSTNLMANTRKRDALSVYMQTTNALELMTEVAEGGLAWAAWCRLGMDECIGMMDSVKSLAGIYQESAGLLAEETNGEARAVAEAAIDETPVRLAGIRNSIVQALAVTNIVRSYAAEFECPEVVSNLNKFIAYGVPAMLDMTNASRFASAATNYSHQATPYLVTTTNAADRAVAVSLASSAEDGFSHASSNYFYCATNLLAMVDAAKSVMSNIHYTALGMHGKYVRTPAYFCNHDSTTELMRIVNSYTNLYTKFPVGLLSTEFSQEHIEEYDSFEELLFIETGFGKITEESVEPPRKNTIFSSRPFVDSVHLMTNAPNAAEASLYVPIEKISRVRWPREDFFQVETYETRNSADTEFHFSVQTIPDYNPEGAYQISSHPTGNPDPMRIGELLYVWTTTNDVMQSIITNSFSHVTMDAPVTYRDSRYQYSSQETRWVLWAMTAWMAPYCALLDGSEPIVNTNWAETVTQRTSTDGKQNNFDFSFLVPEVITAGKRLPVKTICAKTKTVTLHPMSNPSDFQDQMEIRQIYFRTNSYLIPISRATGITDDTVKITKDGLEVHFVNLVADTKYDYRVSYAGWRDWTSDKQHPYTTISGTEKRRLIPFSVPTRYPADESHMFEFHMSNVVLRVKNALEDELCSRIAADFSDIDIALEPPPFMPESLVGQPYVTSYPADRRISISFSITNLYVAANLHFSQGVTNAPKYSVPGYRHLDGLPPQGDPPEQYGWIGPFQLGDTATIDEFTEDYQDLIYSQTNSVPVEVMEQLYEYEKTMITNSYPLNVIFPQY